MLGHVKSQEEFESANSELTKAFEYKIPFNSRKVVYKTRFALMNALLKFHFGNKITLFFKFQKTEAVLILITV